MLVFGRRSNRPELGFRGPIVGILGYIGNPTTTNERTDPGRRRTYGTGRGTGGLNYIAKLGGIWISQQ